MYIYKAHHIKSTLLNLIVILVLTLFSTGDSLFAGGRVKLLLGKVEIEYKGKKTAARLSMIIHDSAVIITGKDGLISVYNSKSNNVLTVGPNRRVPLRRVNLAASSRSIWNKIFASKSMRDLPAVISAIRGFEEGEEKVDWADTDDEKIDRVADWQLYSKRRYKELLQKTRSSRDDEGMFLEAMATYMLYGPSRDKTVLDRLQKVERITSNKPLKLESQRMMALINFELGKYPDSLTHLKRYIRFKKDKDIDEMTYYMLIVNNRYLGNKKVEKNYHRKMKRFHKDSKLLEKL